MLSNAIIIDTRKELSIKYKRVLDSTETSVTVVNNLMDAFKYIQSNEPDLIIISDSIPESLEEFCHKIRVLTYNMRPIIIALSKSAEMADRIKVLESGADDFISEPVNMEEFKSRIKAHLRREIETNLDTKTLLPNKKYSMRALKRILSQKDDWAVLLVGIDNFIPYTEIYTELAGDRVIQAFIAIMKSSLTEKDFLSQVSENEFLIITHPTTAEKIASFLAFAFDTIAPKFYSSEDAKRGYMLLQGDEFAGIRVQFLSVSIGVVSCEFDSYNNAEKLLSKLYHVKSLAKLPSKSNYIVDRPKLSGESFSTNERFNNKIAVFEKDDALALLLRTTLELQGYDVISTMEELEEYTPSIILIDSGDDMKGLELCNRLKNSNEYVKSKIIATSVYHDKTIVLNSGADLYIPKPYEISTIIKWVEYFVNQIIY
ncbi:MAG: response regulator [Candidatus Gastranaerophilaceae bacterium]